MVLCVTFPHAVNSGELYELVTPNIYLDGERIDLKVEIIDLGEQVRLKMDGDIESALYLVTKCWGFAPFNFYVGG